MSLGEWTQLMKDASFIDSHFTKRESTLCFFWSLCFVADEVRAARGCFAATWRGDAIPWQCLTHQALRCASRHPSPVRF
jgi:hypothetical protein